MEKKYELILGSSSPRRKDLLQVLGIPFSILSPNVDETLTEDLTLEQQCQHLSKIKAHKIKESFSLMLQQSPKLILSADTLVGIGDIKLEKPKDLPDCKKMLSLLSGKKHHVITSVTFLFQDLNDLWHEVTSSALTTVEFHILSEKIIDYYVASKDGLDKAGAYGIQGFAQSFVKSLHGTYANVVGLPIDVVVQFLEMYFTTKELHWRERFI